MAVGAMAAEVMAAEASMAAATWVAVILVAVGAATATQDMAAIGADMAAATDMADAIRTTDADMDTAPAALLAA